MISKVKEALRSRGPGPSDLRLSYLLKHWASLQMMKGRFKSASALLDLDLVLLFEDRQNTDPNTDPNFALQGKNPNDLLQPLRCDHCSVKPIVGFRYRCKSCFYFPWFDICSKCVHSAMTHPHATFQRVPSVMPLRNVTEQINLAENCLETE